MKPHTVKFLIRKPPFAPEGSSDPVLRATDHAGNEFVVDVIVLVTDGEDYMLGFFAPKNEKGERWMSVNLRGEVQKDETL